MIDLEDVRKRPDAYRDAARRKGLKFDVDSFLEMDRAVKAAKQALEAQRSEQNAFNKELPKLSGDAKQSKLAEMKSFSAKVKEDEGRFRELEAEWLKRQLLIPGIPLDRVPDGKTDADNVEIRRWGETP